MSRSEIGENLRRVRARVREAALAAGRDPAAVTLIAVSKTKPVEAVAQALDAGQRHFGENYVQEAVAKIEAVSILAPAADPVWHFIGAIQTNKTRDIAQHFDWVHTVSREKEARRLNAQRPAATGRFAGAPLNVCLQVNVDGDPNKAGVPPENVAALLERCRPLEHLALRGLMTILDPRTAPADGYNRLRECFDSVAHGAPAGWDTLSMGMSGDYAQAIAAGATMVRVGTAIFGARDSSDRRAD